ASSTARAGVRASTAHCAGGGHARSFGTRSFDVGGIGSSDAADTIFAGAGLSSFWPLGRFARRNPAHCRDTPQRGAERSIIGTAAFS
ncbi:hypothetical protein, partial [Mycobacterium avium]